MEVLVKQPTTDDPSFPSCDINNSMVMSRLIHSMEPSLVEIYLLYPTAKAIWDAIHLAYSGLEDSSQMFSLRTQVCGLRQEGTSVTQCFNYLKKLWQELDLYNNQQWHDPTNAEIYKKTLPKEQIYDFLASLNPSLDDVLGRILSLTTS